MVENIFDGLGEQGCLLGEGLDFGEKIRLDLNDLV